MRISALSTEIREVLQITGLAHVFGIDNELQVSAA
jgi:hypothetical protein